MCDDLFSGDDCSDLSYLPSLLSIKGEMSTFEAYFVIELYDPYFTLETVYTVVLNGDEVSYDSITTGVYNSTSSYCEEFDFEYLLKIHIFLPLWKNLST
ncbi:hypothetical protein GEMRC1_011218 [Eukaryota sp. GEM-RC1]